MSKRRVVVTGIGIVCPTGIGVAEAWRNIVAGRSGITRISKFDPSALPCQIAGEVKGFDVSAYLSPKEARRFDTFVHFSMAAAIEACKDAGIEPHPPNADRIGCVIGSGIGGLPAIADTVAAFNAGGLKKVSPFFIPGCIINMPAGLLSILHGFKGPNLAIATACTTSNHCIGEAGRIIEYGDADVIIAGGTESALSPFGIAGFCAPKALSTRNSDPAAASRPWDQGRDGFVMGEGAGIVVLEEYEHAKARGAKIYCELLGYGMSGDAYHVTAPTEDGDGAARCMVSALRNAHVNADDVDYINAHGTSTQLGDIAETLAVKRCFGDHSKKLAVSSTKSMTGHLLGAAGGIEAVFSVLAIRDQVLPPTINLVDQDPVCDLDYVANEARSAKVDVVLSNSFGFGGTNGTLVFRKI